MKRHHWQKFQNCFPIPLDAWEGGNREVSKMRSWSWDKTRSSLYFLQITHKEQCDIYISNCYVGNSEDFSDISASKEGHFGHKKIVKKNSPKKWKTGQKALYSAVTVKCFLHPYSLLPNLCHLTADPEPPRCQIPKLSIMFSQFCPHPTPTLSPHHAQLVLYNLNSLAFHGYACPTHPPESQFCHSLLGEKSLNPDCKASRRDCAEAGGEFT